MGISLVNLSGSGKITDDSLINYSYSEDVTSLEPSTISGGTGQVNASALAEYADKTGNTHPNTALLINNDMQLIDSAYGSVQFNVKQVSIADGAVSLVGDTIQSRLNVVVTAAPQGGGATLYSALVYYCSLVGITPTFTGASFITALQAKTVNFIGFKGNLWENLKMLCAGVSINTTGNIGIEMYVSTTTLVFRQALSAWTSYTTDDVGSRSLLVENFDAAQSLTISNYSTSYGTNKVVKDINARADIYYPLVQNVSITDSMQVDAGATVVRRFTINATLTSVNQPTCVASIGSFPYSGTTGAYVIVGSDDLPIQPAQWIAQGGSLVVSLTENPDEIEVRITAPSAPSLPQNANPANVGYAPYRVGVESSGGTDYPAFYITGTGVFYDRKDVKFLTGASPSYTARAEGTSIDNPFITNMHDLSTRGVAAAQAACGPIIKLSEGVAANGKVAYGSTPGQVKKYLSNKFRVVAANYGIDSASLDLIDCAQFSDFNTKWTGKTFADFKSIVLDPTLYPTETLKFNEFSVIPLMESA